MEFLFDKSKYRFIVWETEFVTFYYFKCLEKVEGVANVLCGFWNLLVLFFQRDWIKNSSVMIISYT